MVLLQRQGSNSCRGGGGGNSYSGGPTFSRGVRTLISIETHITCDFPRGRGGPGPYPPSGSAHA